MDCFLQWFGRIKWAVIKTLAVGCLFLWRVLLAPSNVMKSFIVLELICLAYHRVLSTAWQICLLSCLYVGWDHMKVLWQASLAGPFWINWVTTWAPRWNDPIFWFADLTHFFLSFGAQDHWHPLACRMTRSTGEFDLIPTVGLARDKGMVIWTLW